MKDITRTKPAVFSVICARSITQLHARIRKEALRNAQRRSPNELQTKTPGPGEKKEPAGEFLRTPKQVPF